MQGLITSPLCNPDIIISQFSATYGDEYDDTYDDELGVVEFDPIAAAHHASRQRERQKAQYAPTATESRLETNPNIPVQSEEDQESTENTSSRPSSRNRFKN